MGEPVPGRCRKTYNNSSVDHLSPKGDEEVGKDLFHPLGYIKWYQFGRLPKLPDPMYGDWLVQSVFLNGKVYLHLNARSHAPIMYRSSLNFASWTEIPCPKVESFALSTYQSQLVVVGGNKIRTDRPVNTMWMSPDGSKWKLSPRRLPTKRNSMIVVNTGTPEYLVVIGGVGYNEELMYTVEALIDGHWYTLQSLPRQCISWYTKFTFHNRHLYMMGGEYALHCTLDALMDACAAAARDDGELKPGALWNELETAHSRVSTPFVFERQLVSIINGNGSRCKIRAYSPSTNSWVHIGDSPFLYCTPGTIVPVNKGGLIVIGKNNEKYVVFMAALRVSAYSPDIEFTTRAFSKLEAAGIPVVTTLEKVYGQLKETAMVLPGFFIPWYLTPEESFETVIEQWIAGKSILPPTWRSLYNVLRKLNLGELSDQIEEYLSDSCPVKTLKELCMLNIVRTLLKQRSLEPDQLHTRLPDYVPPRTKGFIVHNFKISAKSLPIAVPRPPSSKKRRGV